MSAKYCILYNMKLFGMAQRLPPFAVGTHPSLVQTPKVLGGLGPCSYSVSVQAVLACQALAESG